MEITVRSAGIESLGQACLPFGRCGRWLPPGFLPHVFRGLEIPSSLTAQWAKVIEERMQEFVEGADEGMRRTSPAEMVFFQGPHFGDRYGIVDTALRALAAKGIKMTATACSGSCIYIVLPEGKSEEAVLALSEVFEIPKTSSHKRSMPTG